MGKGGPQPFFQILPGELQVEWAAVDIEDPEALPFAQDAGNMRLNGLNRQIDVSNNDLVNDVGPGDDPLELEAQELVEEEGGCQRALCYYGNCSNNAVIQHDESRSRFRGVHISDLYNSQHWTDYFIDALDSNNNKQQHAKRRTAPGSTAFASDPQCDEEEHLAEYSTSHELQGEMLTSEVNGEECDGNQSKGNESGISPISKSNSPSNVEDHEDRGFSKGEKKSQLLRITPFKFANQNHMIAEPRCRDWFHKARPQEVVGRTLQRSTAISKRSMAHFDKNMFTKGLHNGSLDMAEASMISGIDSKVNPFIKCDQGVIGADTAFNVAQGKLVVASEIHESSDSLEECDTITSDESEIRFPGSRSVFKGGSKGADTQSGTAYAPNPHAFTASSEYDIGTYFLSHNSPGDFGLPLNTALRPNAQDNPMVSKSECAVRPPTCWRTEGKGEEKNEKHCRSDCTATDNASVVSNSIVADMVSEISLLSKSVQAFMSAKSLACIAPQHGAKIQTSQKSMPSQIHGYAQDNSLKLASSPSPRKLSIESDASGPSCLAGIGQKTCQPTAKQHRDTSRKETSSFNNKNSRMSNDSRKSTFVEFQSASIHIAMPKEKIAKKPKKIFNDIIRRSFRDKHESFSTPMAHAANSAGKGKVRQLQKSVVFVEPKDFDVLPAEEASESVGFDARGSSPLHSVPSIACCIVPDEDTDERSRDTSEFEEDGKPTSEQCLQFTPLSHNRTYSLQTLLNVDLSSSSESATAPVFNGYSSRLNCCTSSRESWSSSDQFGSNINLMATDEAVYLHSSHNEMDAETKPVLNVTYTCKNSDISATVPKSLNLSQSIISCDNYDHGSLLFNQTYPTHCSEPPEDGPFYLSTKVRLSSFSNTVHDSILNSDSNVHEVGTAAACCGPRFSCLSPNTTSVESGTKKRANGLSTIIETTDGANLKNTENHPKFVEIASENCMPANEIQGELSQYSRLEAVKPQFSGENNTVGHQCQRKTIYRSPAPFYKRTMNTTLSSTLARKSQLSFSEIACLPSKRSAYSQNVHSAKITVVDAFLASNPSKRKRGDGKTIKNNFVTSSHVKRNQDLGVTSNKCHSVKCQLLVSRSSTPHASATSQIHETESVISWKPMTKSSKSQRTDSKFAAPQTRGSKSATPVRHVPMFVTSQTPCTKSDTHQTLQSKSTRSTTPVLKSTRSPTPVSKSTKSLTFVSSSFKFQTPVFRCTKAQTTAPKKKKPVNPVSHSPALRTPVSKSSSPYLPDAARLRNIDSNTQQISTFRSTSASGDRNVSSPNPTYNHSPSLKSSSLSKTLKLNAVNIHSLIIPAALSTVFKTGIEKPGEKLSTDKISTSYGCRITECKDRISSSTHTAKDNRSPKRKINICFKCNKEKKAVSLKSEQSSASDSTTEKINLPSICSKTNQISSLASGDKTKTYVPCAESPAPLELPKIVDQSERQKDSRPAATADLLWSKFAEAQREKIRKKRTEYSANLSNQQHKQSGTPTDTQKKEPVLTSACGDKSAESENSSRSSTTSRLNFSPKKNSFAEAKKGWIKTTLANVPEEEDAFNSAKSLQKSQDTECPKSSSILRQGMRKKRKVTFETTSLTCNTWAVLEDEQGPGERDNQTPDSADSAGAKAGHERSDTDAPSNQASLLQGFTSESSHYHSNTLDEIEALAKDETWLSSRDTQSSQTIPARAATGKQVNLSHGDTFEIQKNEVETVPDRAGLSEAPLIGELVSPRADVGAYVIINGDGGYNKESTVKQKKDIENLSRSDNLKTAKSEERKGKQRNCKPKKALKNHRSKELTKKTGPAAKSADITAAAKRSSQEKEAHSDMRRATKRQNSDNKSTTHASYTETKAAGDKARKVKTVTAQNPQGKKASSGGAHAARWHPDPMGSPHVLAESHYYRHSHLVNVVVKPLRVSVSNMKVKVNFCERKKEPVETVKTKAANKMKKNFAKALERSKVESN